MIGPRRLQSGEAELDLQLAGVTCVSDEGACGLCSGAGSRWHSECSFRSICKHLTALMEADEMDSSLNWVWGIPQTVFHFVIAFVSQVKGWLLQSFLFLLGSSRGREMGWLHSPAARPSRPLRFSASSSAVPLASDRNLELSGLGINCLNEFVQIASLTSYLKWFLKYTGALCKLLYKLWSPLLLLAAASVSLT